MKPALAIGLLATSIAILSAGNGFASEEEEFAEATREVRTAAAKATLEKNPATVTVYVKGLCCPSCAIGIRKKVGKLKFVDKNRLTKGVELDTKTQLATVALKEGRTPDADALAKAVSDAGYDPVLLYRLSEGKLRTTPLTAQ